MRTRKTMIAWAMLCRDDPFPGVPVCGNAAGSLAVYRTKAQALAAHGHPSLAHDYPIVRVRLTLLGKRPRP